jgi:hypothetical protein
VALTFALVVDAWRAVSVVVTVTKRVLTEWLRTRPASPEVVEIAAYLMRRAILACGEASVI